MYSLTGVEGVVGLLGLSNGDDTDRFRKAVSFPGMALDDGACCCCCVDELDSVFFCDLSLSIPRKSESEFFTTKRVEISQSEPLGKLGWKRSHWLTLVNPSEEAPLG